MTSRDNSTRTQVVASPSKTRSRVPLSPVGHTEGDSKPTLVAKLGRVWVGQRRRSKTWGLNKARIKVVASVSSLLCIGHIVVTLCSSQLLEANLSGLLSEASPADHELVLSDETLLVGADAAGTRVLSVLSGVGVLLVGHLSTGGVVCFLDLLFINNFSSNHQHSIISRFPIIYLLI